MSNGAHQIDGVDLRSTDEREPRHIASAESDVREGHHDVDFGAVDVALTPDDLREIDEASSKITIHGARYSENSQRMVDR